ncbi:SDR family NAD(P)-dependent oxidoreductase [Haladaptatus sp.]|uniref:SDR family NAD(P)-dependent oxidoreductase n=1 Tax=Haladaptatus sp. TaxID=1973141 RepID=UPI003C4BE5CC
MTPPIYKKYFDWWRVTGCGPMDELLSGSVAVITGGSSGNGRAIARTFAEEGADIVVADIRDSPREGGTPTHEAIAAETGSGDVRQM